MLSFRCSGPVMQHWTWISLKYVSTLFKSSAISWCWKVCAPCHHANRVKIEKEIAFRYRELADVVRHAEPTGAEEQSFVQWRPHVLKPLLEITTAAFFKSGHSKGHDHSGPLKKFCLRCPVAFLSVSAPLLTPLDAASGPEHFLHRDNSCPRLVQYAGNVRVLFC